MTQPGSPSGVEDPTRVEYVSFADAYDFFNDALFGGQLPTCLITLQRKPRMYGYYSHERFETRTGDLRTDEIALNPATFSECSDKKILSTLVHEQAHLWQFHFGNPSRVGYHNAEWADRMESLGLIPSNTGEPGGKRTGQGMSHYIVSGEPFDVACDRLLSRGFRLEWQSAEDGSKKPRKPESKVKYTCGGCGQNAWAKPGASLACARCDAGMAGADGTPAPDRKAQATGV